MTLSIELTDQQADTLRASAAAHGLSLQAWIENRAGLDRPAGPFETGYGMLAQYGPAPSAEEIDDNRRDMFHSFAAGV